MQLLVPPQALQLLVQQCTTFPSLTSTAPVKSDRTRGRKCDRLLSVGGASADLVGPRSRRLMARREAPGVSGHGMESDARLANLWNT